MHCQHGLLQRLRLVLPSVLIFFCFHLVKRSFDVFFHKSAFFLFVNPDQNIVHTWNKKNPPIGESVAYMLLLNEFLYISKMTISEIQKIDLYLLKLAVFGLCYDIKKTMLWNVRISRIYQTLKRFRILNLPLAEYMWRHCAWSLWLQTSCWEFHM